MLQKRKQGECISGYFMDEIQCIQIVPKRFAPLWGRCFRDISNLKNLVVLGDLYHEICVYEIQCKQSITEHPK